MDRATIEARLSYWRDHLARLMDAYAELVEGGVKSYSISDRELIKFEISNLRKAIDDAEDKVEEYENMLNSLKPRRAFGVVPRDW